MIQPRLCVEWIPKKKKWMLKSVMYVQTRSFGIIEVRVGFHTDLGSYRFVPIPFITMLLDGYGVEAHAVHDWLYATGQLTRKQSDLVYYEVLRTLGVARWRAIALYAGVRAFGWFFWRH